jgi:hypothetical protein
MTDTDKLPSPLFEGIRTMGKTQTDSFDLWMLRVNAIVEKRADCSCADLPDYCYVDDFEDGATPSQTATAALREAGI